LECTLAGPRLRFLRAAWIAVAGADLGATLVRADLGRFVIPPARYVRVRPGNVLVFEGARSGARSYVAIGGSFAVPRVLGSCATDLGAGFGGGKGRALHAGDVLFSWPDRPPPVDGGAPGGWHVESEPAVLRIHRGLQYDALAAESVATLLASEYEV